MGSKLDTGVFQDHQAEEMEVLPKEGVVVVEVILHACLLLWLWLIHVLIDCFWLLLLFLFYFQNHDIHVKGESFKYINILFFLVSFSCSEQFTPVNRL